MKQIAFSRRHSIAESRRVPLNTVILPPLTPPPQENDNNFALLINKAKEGGRSELILAKAFEPQNEDLTLKSAEQVRLEQNIRFLQEQHQHMLGGLHLEVEKLKARNRELQFQLVFGKGPIPSSSPSPSSPEDESAKHKVYSSPKILTNTTPLQVELLEKELGELKLQMQELESRNVYLSAIVDEQKKKLERYDRRREKEREHRANGQAEEVELLRKLEDAESLIRRLRRENSDLRRENQMQATTSNRENNGYHQSGRGGQGHRGGSGRGHRNGNGHYGRGGWFPPLHTQNFWQGGRQPANDRNPQEGGGPSLPNIPVNENNQYHGRKNNHQYHNGDGRKYRGGYNRGSKPS